MKDYAIRPAVLKEAEQIFNLIRQHKDDLISRPIGDIIQNIDRFVVCEAEGQIVGCATWQILPEIGAPERASVEIQSVAVHADYRRHHIGSQIVQDILKRIRRFDPMQAIVLTFAPDFFATLGFRPIAKTQVMHKLYMGCINCTKHANPFTCPEIAMALDLRS
jgi:N-acetylglutamate synthase-like GNAT family acetyltransferase